MRIAIIDLGTNSVRFDVHQIGPKNNLYTLHREKVMVRLGQGVFVKGRLDASAIHRTAHAFANFKAVCDALSVEKILALATSALREASDAPKLIALVRRTTGIEIRVISGAEEARLIALGVLAGEASAKSRGKVALLDIGGGSTEMILTRDRRVRFCDSFPLGTARLQQVFLKKSPPTRESIHQLRHYIRSVLETQEPVREASKYKEIIGSSGTVKALMKLVKKTSGKKNLDLEMLQRLVRKMSRMTTTQLLGVAGMEAKRVDMILAGAILLEECMLKLGAQKVIPTDYSLRDGILQEQIELAKRHARAPLALHLPDLMHKARRLGASEAHLRQKVRLADALFEKLAKVHRLRDEWKLYLQAAVILRNAGEAISLIGHAVHSDYIVRQARFPFFEEWEAELVALLCRFHEAQKLDAVGATYEKDPARRAVFLKLLGLLCLLDALDAEPHAAVDIRRIHLKPRMVKLWVSKGSTSDLEVFRAEQRQVLFEQIFRRKLLVQRA